MYVTHKTFSDASSQFWDPTKTGNFLWAMNLGGIERDLSYNEDMCAPLSTVLSACSLSLRVCHKADSSACPSTVFIINRAIPFIGFRAEYYYKSQPVRQWLAHGNQPVRRSQWSENSIIKEAGSRERCSWKVCNHMEHRASPTAIYNAGTPQKKICGSSLMQRSIIKMRPTHHDESIAQQPPLSPMQVQFCIHGSRSRC